MVYTHINVPAIYVQGSQENVNYKLEMFGLQ